MIFNAGMLNRRVQVCKPETGTREEFDYVNEGVLFSCWASIQPLRGKEYYENKRVANTENVKIIIRYRKGISHDCVIRYKEHRYRIQSIVNPYEENESLELYCIEERRGVPAKEREWEP